MDKRAIKIGNYDTGVNLWTLEAWELSAPQYEANLVTIPGGVPLDLAMVLTGGWPYYGARTLTAQLTSSEGTRLEREARISAMVNQLDGLRLDIILPDDADHYLQGRVSVARDYNDPAHAGVTVTSTCDPWRYANEDTVIQLTATTEEQSATLTNGGRLPVVPTITVAGGSVTLAYDAASWSLSTGTYALPELHLTPGEHTISYSGSGTLTLSWREAIL